MQQDHRNAQLTDLERQLLKAVDEKFFSKAEKLLSKKGVSPECRDGQRRTPLMKAAEAGDPGMVRLLLRNGANRNAVDSDGETARVKAERNGHLDVVELLDSGPAEIASGDIDIPEPEKVGDEEEMALDTDLDSSYSDVLAESDNTTESSNEDITTTASTDDPSSEPVEAVAFPDEHEDTYNKPNDGSTALEIAQMRNHDALAAPLSGQSADSVDGVGEEISTDPEDDDPPRDGLAGALLPVAAAMIPSSEPRSYVPELDLEALPSVAESPYFKLQKAPESVREEKAKEATEEQEEEQDSSSDQDEESYANPPKEKPTVSQMVAKVKTFLVTYVIMGLEAIGDYLLENVFDGNYKKALSKDPYKGTSLSDIADHKDMPLSRQRLGECVRVAAETQELKSFGLESDFLTYYHKLEISRVKSPEERLKLAQEANSKSLTVREVRDRVRKLTGKAVSADKRMAQAVIKQLGVFSQMSVDEETREFLKDKDRLKEALTTGETAKLLDHSEKFREAVGESEEILHRLERTLVEIVVERRQEDETDSE